MEFNAIFNNISVISYRSVLLVEEAERVIFSCSIINITCEPFDRSIFLPILRVPAGNFQNLPSVKKIQYNKILIYILRSIFLEIPHLELPR